MQKLTIRCCLLAGLVFFSVCCKSGDSSFAADNQEISWFSYEDGLARAKAENKKIFLHFFTNKCHYCKVMATKTFVDEKVINLLNDSFISIKVNLENRPGMTSQYPARGVPTSWFLESNGNKIGVKPGYLPPDQFMEILQFLVAEKYKTINKS